MMLGRRALLGAGAALVMGTSRLPPSLRDLLDEAAAEKSPGKALALLRSPNPDWFAPGDRLDLVTARAGLEIDAEIARRGVDPHKPALPVSPELYLLLLRRKVGDTPDLAAIGARLAGELARTTGRAAILLRQLGIRGDTPGACFTTLWHDEHYLYPDSDAGRAQLIADMNGTLAARARDIPALIGAVPAYSLKVAAIRPSPADEATGHVGFRALPTPLSAGGYYPDLLRVRERPSWTLPSVVAHELIPGHMIQMPMEAAAAPHPLRLEYAPTFGEGWGIYAERLIADRGAYAAEARTELGYLHWRLFRITRALADLGLHTRGWSLDQAHATLVRTMGEPAYFAPFETDLKRIAGDPGTRAGEMLAALALEDGAHGRQGPALVRFHQAVLRHGRMRVEQISRAS